MIDVLRFVEHPLMHALGWSLLHFVWQGAMIGLATYVVLRGVRPTAASTRYLVGVAALSALLIAPIATFVSLANDEASVPASGPLFQSRPSTSVAGSMVTGSMFADVEANPTAARQLIPPGGISKRSKELADASPVWLAIIAAAWMIGVVVLSVRMLGGWVITRMLTRRAVATVSPVIDAAAREIARRLELQRGVEILESAAVSVPTLIGWVRPVVLLPASALTGLSPVHLEAILAHELAHVRRHDYLINLLQSLVETLLFYHPAVWWVSAEVRAERENCCDDLAVAVCGDRLVYVSALAELTALDRKLFALAATDGSLLTRVRRILGRPTRRRELPPSWSILAVVALLATGAGTYEMSTTAVASTDSDTPIEIAIAADAEQPSTTTNDRSNRASQERLRQQARRLEEAADALSRAADKARAHREEIALRQAEYEARRAEFFALQAAYQQALEQVAPVAPVAPAPPAAPTVSAPKPPAQPAPPALPALPALAAPPDPATQRGEGNFSWSNNGERISVKWTGSFRLSDDERDIVWVEPGARVTITDGNLTSTHRVELRGLDDGKVERTYYANGTKTEWETEGRQFLANAIARMIRSGMFAADRVARFLKQGGPDAVLAEIDRLQSTSSHFNRVYYSALLKQAELNASLLQRVLDGVAKQVTSDHDKGILLAQILQEESATDDQRVAVARAVHRMKSDHEKRKVILSVIARDPLPDSVATAAIDASLVITSAHDRGVVLSELARKGAVTPRTSAAFMGAVTSMSSGHEQRKVLAMLAAAPALSEQVAVDAVKASGAIVSSHDQRQALAAYMARDDASPKMAAAAIASTANMASSHDKTMVLLEIVQKGGLTDQTASAFFNAATTIASSHDLSRLLLGVSARPNLSEGVLTGLLRATEKVTSGHDRANVLLEILRVQRLSPAARQIFLSSAQAIGSTHDQNRVLAELVRSERR